LANGTKDLIIPVAPGDPIISSSPRQEIIPKLTLESISA
jgi:hypothetical protein